MGILEKSIFTIFIVALIALLSAMGLDVAGNREAATVAGVIGLSLAAAGALLLSASALWWVWTKG